jgi:oligopeptide/dipeptide ABC transporter ATP-binding protein
MRDSTADLDALASTNAGPENAHGAAVNAEMSGRAIPDSLHIRQLTIAYPSYGKKAHQALTGVTLSILPGEIVGLVGESGSGKTTLARSILGMVPQPGIIEGGEVIFNGQDLAKLSVGALRSIRGRHISMMVPNPRSELNPLQTVGQQIANVAHEHLGGTRRDAAKMAMDMLQAVRIPDAKRRFDAYPHELSGGMAQRVVIAIALICSPKLIISDDATSGLDVTVQAQVLELMSALVREKNASMLFITRDIGITAHFCSQVAVMYGGEIVELAGTGPFFERPAHPYSIMLLAAFSHNPALRARWTKDTESQYASLAAETGCRFRYRCVRAQDRCEAEKPVLRPIADAHSVRCHFPVERST